jgi:hypothetical protein
MPKGIETEFFAASGQGWKRFAQAVFILGIVRIDAVSALEQVGIGLNRMQP